MELKVDWVKEDKEYIKVVDGWLDDLLEERGIVS